MTGLRPRARSRAAAGRRVLMLSMHDNEQYFFEALEAGAVGYVLKTSADRDLVAPCRAAMRGEPFLYPRRSRAIVREHLERARRGEPAPQDPLTPREQESSSSSPRPTPTTRSPSCWSSARRRSSATARTSSRSSGCTTASS